MAAGIAAHTEPAVVIDNVQDRDLGAVGHRPARLSWLAAGQMSGDGFRAGVQALLGQLLAQPNDRILGYRHPPHVGCDATAGNEDRCSRGRSAISVRQLSARTESNDRSRPAELHSVLVLRVAEQVDANRRRTFLQRPAGEHHPFSCLLTLPGAAHILQRIGRNWHTDGSVGDLGHEDRQLGHDVADLGRSSSRTPNSDRRAAERRGRYFRAWTGRLADLNVGAALLVFANPVRLRAAKPSSAGRPQTKSRTVLGRRSVKIVFSASASVSSSPLSARVMVVGESRRSSAARLRPTATTACAPSASAF
jgi:hypothetical protein